MGNIGSAVAESSPPTERISRRRIRLAGQDGQSLIIVVLAMFVVIGISAVAIDIATWYQKHHQAQVAADSAALAAANCLANAGVTIGTTPNQCTTGTDTTDATSAATSLAAANGVSIPSSAVTINTTTTTSAAGCPATSVCVTANNSAPALFAGLIGPRSGSQVAKATASYTAPISPKCSNPSSGGCYFAFAKDSSCGDTGITLSNNGNATVNGGIWSNSGLNMSNTDNNGHWGNVTYGQGCTYTPSSKNKGPSFVSGPSPHSPLSAWPRDYTSVITCSSSGCNSSTAPSFCTQSQPSFGTSTSSYPVVSGNVYCAYGSGTPGNPATWNGNIYAGFSTGTYSDSFIGGYVNAQLGPGSVTLNPQLNTTVGSLLAYANNSSDAADISTQGKANLNGDVFAPNGTVNLTTGGSGLATTFLEANQVNVSASGGITGDGPQTGTDGTTLAGADVLTQ